MNASPMFGRKKTEGSKKERFGKTDFKKVSGIN